MTEHALDEMIEFAALLADTSAGVIKEYWREGLRGFAKRDGSPATIADHKAEKVMRALIEYYYPDHNILGEEMGQHDDSSEYEWTLDPIAGTKNFIAGSLLFGTFIGLLHRGEPILGVINLPLNDQMLIGTRTGTLLNEQPVRVRPCAALEDALMLCSYHREVGNFHPMQPYEALIRQVNQYYTWGCAHGYYQVATGYADIMMDPKLSYWDVLPIKMVVEGAGGRISDWYGGDVLQGSSAVVTAGEIHDQVIALLNPAAEAVH